MFKWEKLYELNDKNNKKAGEEFEKLVLSYLESVYSKYSWKNTKSSWDNNRDFISLILDNIWGEAKYKKDSSPLGKKDVDPTMVSGFLNGKIRLVFIITNGQIPQTIAARINATGKRCGFTVVCITQTQLEYWLIAHPEQYKAFFKESIPKVCQLDAVSIENARLENQLETNFESSYIQPEFITESICNLCITFNCNTEIECIIVEKEEYPFSLLEVPIISLSPGIQQKYFPIQLVRPNSEPIALEFRKADGILLSCVLDVKIVNKKNMNLIYSQQELIKMEILDSINVLSNTNDNCIIFIQGEEGYGKTFLMKELAKDLSFFHVVSVLQCEPPTCLGLNSMKLCQMIMYINYGDIYRNSEEYSEGTKDYYKYLLKKNNRDKIIEDELLLDIFEGCFDRIVALNIINRLSEGKSIVIKKSEFARRHILLMDDIHLLTNNESIVFNMILKQLLHSCNDIVLIVASKEVLINSPEIIPYELNGLSNDDIKECLKHNLKKWQYNAFSFMVSKMPHHPKMLSELINFIMLNTTTNSSLDNVNQYITKLYYNKLTNFRFNLSIDEKTILELIFNFSKGLSEQLLYAVKIDKKILKSLSNKGYIIYYKQRYIPCADYFQYTYNNQQRNVFSNAYLAEYLTNLLEYSYIDPLFDTFQAQLLLMQCSPKLYLQLKKNYKHKMLEYINKSYYKEAMVYGEIFCFDMLNEKSGYNDIDLDSLFYFGIASIHCDAQRRAMDIFTFIKNHSEKNTLIFFKASAELLNNKYSRFQIDDIIPESIVLKYNIFNALSKIKDENSSEMHQLRISYSTCMNRIMMIYFLNDNHKMALETYNEFCTYHSSLPDSSFTDKYYSMLLEWKMDYARGSVAYDLQNTIDLEEECYNCFSGNIDFRRKILCKIDKLFFTAIQTKNYDAAIIELINCKNELTIKGIVSEGMKAAIRITYCQLMKYASIPEFNDITLLAPIVDDIYAEVFSAQLETHIITQGRTAYLLNNLLTILHIIKNEIEIAIELLKYGKKLIQSCGIEYHHIIEHNFQHIREIKKINWYFYNEIMYNDTYYLDIRVW